VRDDAGTRLELAEELRAHHQVHLGQQVDAHDRCPVDIGLVQILRVENGPVGHALPGRVGVRQLHQAHIVIDAEAARPVFLRGGNDHPAIARAQIDHVILRSDLGRVEHGLHDVGRRLHIRGVAEILRLRGEGEHGAERDQCGAAARGGRGERRVPATRAGCWIR
jgi:hypothetical protein